MHESVQAERFLNLELDLAITFCDTGFAMSNRTEARRSAEHARKALDTVEKLAHTLRLTKAAEVEISRKFTWATTLLSELERHLDNAVTKSLQPFSTTAQRRECV